MSRQTLTAPSAESAARQGQSGWPVKVCMVVFSHYPSDPRVRREAEALVGYGMSVDVLCLRGRGETARETINGVSTRRLPIARRRGGRLRYIFEYLMFCLAAFVVLGWRSLRRSYAIVHIHNMPDFLVFSALLPRLRGSRIILDLHDPMPEVFQAKYGIAPDSPFFRLLTTIEHASIAFAHLVLTPNSMFVSRFVQRGCPPEKIRIIMNTPDERIFTQELATSAVSRVAGQGFAVMFHGGIYERHGLATALHAIQRVRDQIPGLRFEVFGDGDYAPRFIELVGELRLDDIVHYHGKVALEDIARAIPAIDLGLIPNDNTPFTMINMPTRIFEYLALNRPLIAPRTPGILDYFDERALFFFEPGNVDDLARVLLEATDAAARRRILDRAREVYLRHAWCQEKKALIAEVHRLLGKGGQGGF